ncbi:MAG: dTMP kinase [Candidatus Nanopelagicales bacterium]
MNASLPQLPIRSPRPGFFISFEGGEGVGKSTQIELLKQQLIASGKSVVTPRAPGGTDAAEAIRKVLLGNEYADLSDRSEALLFAAARADVVANVVDPALAAGQVVLADRYLDSSAAYQGYARKLGVAEVKSLSLWATRGLLPDLTVVLDLDATIGINRVAKPDRLESLAREFHKLVREAFLTMAAEEPTRFIVVDASQSTDEINKIIFDQVKTRLAI